MIQRIRITDSSEFNPELAGLEGNLVGYKDAFYGKMAIVDLDETPESLRTLDLLMDEHPENRVFLYAHEYELAA